MIRVYNEIEEDERAWVGDGEYDTLCDPCHEELGKEEDAKEERL